MHTVLNVGVYTDVGRSVMAITSGVTAQQMGQVLAAAVRDDPRIAELWVASRPDAIHLWLISTPITLAEHRSLYGLVGVLYERFPEAAFEVHIRNPRNYRSDVHRGLPSDAEQFPLRSANA